MPLLEQSSYTKQFLALVLVILFSTIVFTLLGILLAVPFVDGNILEMTARMEHAQTAQDVSLLKYFQLISQISLFVISSFLFAFLVSKKPFAYLGLNVSPKGKLLLLALIIALVSSAFFNWLIEMNMRIHLPAALAGLESWMREMEIKAGEMTALFLHAENFKELAYNFLIVAIMAGVGEELLLRGIVQPLFIKLTRNAHLGIWLAAFIFSFIHLQFYGFFPRLILGVLFGYYFYWSKSLWIPILAHIANNGFIVIYAYFGNAEDVVSSLEASTKPADFLSFITVISSFLLTGLGLYLFYIRSTKKAD